jgi:hypothetical protein
MEPTVESKILPVKKEPSPPEPPAPPPPEPPAPPPPAFAHCDMPMPELPIMDLAVALFGSFVLGAGVASAVYYSRRE